MSTAAYYQGSLLWHSTVNESLKNDFLSSEVMNDPSSLETRVHYASIALKNYSDFLSKLHYQAATLGANSAEWKVLQTENATLNKISHELTTVSNIFAIRLQDLRLMKYLNTETPKVDEGSNYLDVAKRIGAYSASIWLNPINIGMSWAGQFVFFKSLPTFNVPGMVIGGGLYAASYYDYWPLMKKVGLATKNRLMD